MNYNEEIWKPVYLENFKQSYEVSNKGRVRRGNRILKNTLTKKGYCRVILTTPQNVKNMPIHRLVKFSFEPVENPEIYDVHHRDRIKTNNELYNLQMLTRKEHRKLEMKIGNNKVGLYGKKSLFFKGLTGIFNKEGYLLNVFEGKYDIELNGFDTAHVSKVILGKYKQHKGFIFKRFPKKHKPEIGKQYDLNDPMFEKTIKKKKPKREVQLAFKF
jgi:hypothetical protein